MRTESGESGFTLIEILVVMLILGVLAAIAVPTFLVQRDKATDADAKVAVRTAQTAAEIIATENNGRFNGPRGVNVANLRAREPTLNGANLTVQLASANQYALRVLAGTGNYFEIRRRPDSSREFTCWDPGKGGCPEDGTWAD